VFQQPIRGLFNVLDLSGPCWRAGAGIVALTGLLLLPAIGEAIQTPHESTQEQTGQTAPDGAAKEAEKIEIFQDFLRVRRDEKKKPVSMETSVTRYIGKNAAGDTVTVDLIGVVHVGEKSYYQQLNVLFESYEGLLYELVAPEGTRIPAGGRDSADALNPVAALQLGMKSVLGLEFQLDYIDYERDNFVHADMTPEEFFESMKNNDESLMKMALKAFGASMAMQQSGGTTDTEMLMALFSRDRDVALRRVMAEQMQNMEASMAIFKGKEGSTIIDHRNAKALSVLQREIEAGKTKLALFYGAGHLPDMQQRLFDDFGMKRAGQFWLTAWNLKSR
jgi:hypothetical protein